MSKQVVLLRVGIDTAAGGALGPVFRDGSFEFIPIPDKYDLGPRTYGDTVGRSGKVLADYLPENRRAAMSSCAMHDDPEWETFTYGDPTRPKAGLQRLVPGDLLVFYAGLRPYAFDGPPALYIVGYFEVELAGLAENMTPKDLHRCRGNFHVRHRRIFHRQRPYLVLVKGDRNSRLLTRAVKISEVGHDRAGRPLHVLSKRMQGVFGDFDGKVSIQRSPPRWVDWQYAAKAEAFVRRLQ